MNRSGISVHSYHDVPSNSSIQIQFTVMSLQNQWACTPCFLKACGLGSRGSIYQTNIATPVFCSPVSVDGGTACNVDN
jgi:hypothetical protein